MIQSRLLTRRSTLKLGLGTLAGIAAVMGVKGAKQIYQNHLTRSLYDPTRSFTLRGEATLKERAAAKGLIYGSAAILNHFSLNEKLVARFAQECRILAPEWELKWAAGDKLLRPSPTEFDFSAGDSMVEFAQTHHQLLQGHALVWHLSLPDWFEDTVNGQNAEQFLVNHIETVAGRYAGKMHSWDVVNEAIELNDGRKDGLRKSPWLEFMGPDYIDFAFRVTAAADPQAMLVYNDYGLEYDIASDEAKRTAVLKLLERLKSQGTPVHALGIQAHLLGHETRFNPQKFRRFLADVASLDLKILITELDVSDQDLPADLLVRDRIVASAYEDYLSVVLNEPAVIAVITWGLSDRYSWLAEFAPRSDGQPVRPLPLDANLNRKLAWNAIARAFDQAPKRQL